MSPRDIYRKFSSCSGVVGPSIVICMWGGECSGNGFLIAPPYVDIRSICSVAARIGGGNARNSSNNFPEV